MNDDTQPDYSGSCMIALYPPPDVAGSLAVDGGLPPGEMHLTIAYTGDAADVDPEALGAVAKSLSGRPPVEATVSGHARRHRPSGAASRPSGTHWLERDEFVPD